MAKWLINANHSVAEFAVRHMMVSWVIGLFTKVTGRLTFDPAEVAAAAVDVEIDASSLYTGVEQRDIHLKSADFLEVEKFPAITFRSTGVEYAGLDHAWVHGELTIRGVTLPATLDVRWAGPSHFDDDGRTYTSFGFRAETRINREDYGMSWNTPMEQGGFMIGKHVFITLCAEVDLLED